MVVTRTVYVKPPSVYAMVTLEPAFNGDTTQDHLNYTLDLREALRECNADKQALRDWAER